ncbi:MAG: helix-turn-helix transcriptional regulator [Candidatus Omnitrophica bacterium]|nr:helix-turn-helix transcriptional regulator [Candidatus Omnitrophota bacterium]
MGELAEQIRKYRRANGKKVYDLAKKARVTPEFITEIEKGRSYPSPKVLERICLDLKYDFRPIYFKERHPDMYALMNNKLIVIEYKHSKKQK